MSSINCVNPICGNRDRVESAVFMKCGACKKVAYCGKACQKSHWKFHKLYCKSIRDAPQVPDMDEIGRRMDELNEALFGNHAPASRRITFRSFGDGSPDSPRAKKFADGLDVGDVMQYGIEKFLETTDKGCVVFNMRYPYMDTKSYSRLTWLSRRGVASTGEPTLLKNVTQYDPAHCVVILFVLPSADLKSVQCWSLETMFTVQPDIEQKVQRVKREWRA